jgi:hypothetical protein
MPIDVGRVVQAALEAVTQGPSSNGEAKVPKPRLSGGRALLLGAGLVTIGRLAAPKGREIVGSLQQKIEELASEPEDEEQQTDEEYDDQPEDEGDEDFDEDDYEEEPEDEGDEDFDEDDYEEDPEGDEDFDDEEPADERPRPRRQTRSRAKSRS